MDNKDDVFDLNTPPAHDDVFDLGEQPSPLAQDDVFDLGEQPTPPKQDDVFDVDAPHDYELSSYGKYAYKRVQKLRRRGKRRGIDVPVLGYVLTRPQKARLPFLIIAVVSAVILVASIVGLGFLYNYIIGSTTDFKGMADVLKAVFDPKTFALSAGLSAIPGIMIVVAYILLFVMLLIPIIALIYVYRFVRDTVYMIKCSKEEFACGGIVHSRIVGLIIGLVVCTLIFAVVAYITEVKMGYALPVFLGIVAALGGLLALTLIERNKCKKWFDGLDEFKKQNYLAHEHGLQRVKSHLRFERNMWSNLGK